MPRDGTDRPQKHRFTQSRGNQCITNRREDGRSHHLDWRCIQGTDSSSGCQELTDSTLTVSLVGMAAFLGHLYPLFYGFKGGKGVATACGVFFGTSGVLTLILFIVWLTVAVISRYSSLAALTAAALAPLIVIWLLPELWPLVMTAFITVLLFWRHRENITRLLAGTESKIKLKSS